MQYTLLFLLHAWTICTTYHYPCNMQLPSLHTFQLQSFTTVGNKYISYYNQHNLIWQLCTNTSPNIFKSVTLSLSCPQRHSCTGPLILNWGARWRWAVNIVLWPLESNKKPQQPLNRRLGVPQSWSRQSEEEKNLMRMTGTELHTTQISRDVMCLKH